MSERNGMLARLGMLGMGAVALGALALTVPPAQAASWTAVAVQPARVVVVQPAPPPVIVETPPPPPRAHMVWRPGHWRWNGRRWIWRPGHYRAVAGW